jgi:hypothetical protein
MLCPGCGFENENDNKFCNMCGMALPSEEKQDIPPAEREQVSIDNLSFDDFNLDTSSGSNSIDLDLSADTAAPTDSSSDFNFDLSANSEKNDENGYSNKRAYKIRSIEGVSQDFFIGKSPYIELSDGYYLVDWKWGNFIYKPFNVLLDVLWSEVQDRQQLWDMETPIISSDFIDKWGTTNRSEIDRYLQIEPAANDTLYGVSTDHLRSDFLGRYHSLSDVPEGIKEDYIHEVERQDSLQRVYAERLTQVIKEGGLKKVAYIYMH